MRTCFAHRYLGFCLSCPGASSAVFFISCFIILLDNKRLGSLIRVLSLRPDGRGAMYVDVGFPVDYISARRAFLDSVEKVREVGIPVDSHSLEVGGMGPEGTTLTVEMAVITPQRESMLIHSSGVHGVEGFAGSAMQCLILDEVQGWYTPEISVMLIHVVNPWGMAWWRRTNRNNVDLNRNFLSDGEEYSGMPELYSDITGFLNPRRPPKRFDSFIIRLLMAVMRHGRKNLKQAIAEGQYEDREGIFFGGEGLQEESAAILGVLSEALLGVRKAMHIDFHTGLGKFGEDALILADEMDAPSLEIVFGPRIEGGSTAGVSYANRGGFPACLIARWPEIEWVGITQEFGTFSNMAILKSMIVENQLTHWSGLDGEECRTHPVRRRFMRGFNPDDQRWRESVLSRGRELFEQGLGFLR